MTGRICRKSPKEFVEAIESQARWEQDTRGRKLWKPQWDWDPHQKTHEAKYVELDRNVVNRRLMATQRFFFPCGELRYTE